MSGDGRGATCTDCGAARPLEPGPCPECGSRNRTVGVGRATETETARPVGAAKGVSVGTAEETEEARPVTVQKVREFVTRHPWWTATGVAAVALSAASCLLGSVVGPIVGVAASLVLGVVGFVAGEKGSTRVREIERRPGAG